MPKEGMRRPTKHVEQPRICAVIWGVGKGEEEGSSREFIEYVILCFVRVKVRSFECTVHNVHVDVAIAVPHCRRGGKKSKKRGE